MSTPPLKLLPSFNPRLSPKEEATSPLLVPRSDADVSIHASPRRKRRPQRLAASCLQQRFNPRLSPKEEATHQGARSAASQSVSIHASPRRKRRPASTAHVASTCGFQSTPLPEGRGDMRVRILCSVVMRFNPRLSPKEEATRSGNRHGRHRRVSIHASPRRKRRQAEALAWFRANEFQSTPLPEGRGDSRLTAWQPP